MNLKLNRLARVVLVASICGFAVSCAVEPGRVYIKDGKQYGVFSGNIWRGRWWNHYERGVSYASGAYWDEAIADFQAAIGQRDEDQRRARTYGLHFIDYFPHRELGIVYYRQGRYRESVRQLEASLASVDNAKAKVYLNRARRAQLLQTGLDRTAPRLRLDGPTDGLVTNRFSTTVSGRAEDDTYVAAIAIQGQDLFIELAEPQVAFSQDIALRDGINRIDVVAVDLLGNETRQQIAVRLDRQGPLLSIDRVEVTGTPPRQRARIQGFVSDQSAVTSFHLAGELIAQPAERAFAHEVPVPSGAKALPFEAVDAAGNVTRGNIALTLPTPVREGKTIAPPPRVRWASHAPGSVLTDAGAVPLAVTQLTQAQAPPAPVINLYDITDEDTVFDERLYLTGEVLDAQAIISFAINGTPLLQHRQPRQLFFGAFFPLREGPNPFRLEATNRAGNAVEHTISVKRELPPQQQIGSRLRVSLLPLVKKGTPSVLSEAIDDQLLNILVNQRRFDLVERVQLDQILQEHKLSQSPIVDPATAIRLGKLINAEGTLIGTVVEQPHALEVLIRFVDVETSQIHAAVDVYDDVEAEQHLPRQRLRTLIEGLAWKLKQAFPLVQGWVLSKEDDGMLIDLTQRHHIRPQMKLIVFREQTIPHPITGRLLQTSEMLGEARITSVFKDLSEATLLTEVEGQQVQQKDKVITK